MIKYPLAKDTIPKSDIKALIKWLETDSQLTKGKLTEEFEAKWSKLIGRKYSVFCNSGSSANLLAADALLKRRQQLNKKYKRIALPAIGWATTVAPFFQLRHDAVLHLLDGDPKSLGISPDSLENICKSSELGLLVVVNVLGIPALWDDILTLQKKFGFDILEDNCAGVGSKHGKKNLGAFGDISTFSFFYGHQYSTIEGGMVCTDDEDLYHYLLMLRSHGWGKDLPLKKYNELMQRYKIDDFAKPFTFFVPGYNLRATDLQAFLGLEQIKRYEKWAQKRHENHLQYRKMLKGSDFILQDFSKKDRVASISVGVRASNNFQRQNVVRALAIHGIETRLFSAGNLARHPFMTVEDDSQLPIADSVHRCGFFLPNYVDLTEEDINYISGVVLDAGTNKA